jgi:hypothetical protein
MRAFKTTIGIATVACALVASLGAPALAVAAPAKAHARSVATTPTPSKRVVKQYRTQSRARLNRFKVNARVITQKLNRYDRITSRVESAGADVTAVRAHIAAARAHVASAKVFANEGAVLLKDVPFAKNRKAAFFAANRHFTAASWQLKMARADKNRAAADLWPLVKKYHLAWKFRWAEFK